LKYQGYTLVLVVTLADILGTKVKKIGNQEERVKDALQSSSRSSKIDLKLFLKGRIHAK